MRIKRITYQHRRDFKAEFECEHCGNTVISWGYDDDNFHRNVIPAMICDNCGKKAPENYQPKETKYAAWEVV